MTSVFAGTDLPKLNLASQAPLGFGWLRLALREHSIFKFLGGSVVFRLLDRRRSLIFRERSQQVQVQVKNSFKRKG